MNRPPRSLVLAATVVAVPLLALASAARGEEKAPAPGAFEPIQPLPSAPRPRAPRAPKDVAEPPAEAERLESGVASRVLRKGGGGAHPGPYDRVVVHYTGWTSGGRTFDSSIPNGEPVTLSMNDVTPGLRQGIQLMAKGEKRRLWIPADLGYGDRSTAPDKPAGALTFDVELVDFASMPEPPQVPPDVEAVPADAKRTASGLAYRFLKRGKGKQRPAASSTVEVHYSGWTPDGKMFDSSVARGKSTSFPLDGVIKGWTEGVQLMVVGDKVRFWIPAALAYGDKPAREGAPAGPLVFEIELLSIK